MGFIVGAALAIGCLVLITTIVFAVKICTEVFDCLKFIDGKIEENCKWFSMYESSVDLTDEEMEFLDTYIEQDFIDNLMRFHPDHVMSGPALTIKKSCELMMNIDEASR